jgi:hypothetical protein
LPEVVAPELKVTLDEDVINDWFVWVHDTV